MELRSLVKNGIFLALLLALNSATGQQKAGEELKVNVSSITNSIGVLNQLDPKTYNYDSRLKLPSGKQYGFVVGDFSQQYPELVKEKVYSVPAGKNAYRQVTVDDVDMQKLIPVLVGAIKEQQLEIENLKRELTAIKGSR